ncbi:MAG: phage Gp37/Gp68 family protein [Nitrospirota bacterium]|nr:phage Gp37/Gp68 family protein [Nitrospirota bacterium]MDP3595367.1 phage Gp37/Gp68 family protein [Nitrospirota bacterium]
MSTATSIEWTDKTWNPVRGCSMVSAGCTNCYAMKQAHRFSGPDQAYDGLTELGPQGARWTGEIRLVPDALLQPLHWRNPRKIFVNSMSDLFHRDVPHEFLVKVFAVMALTPQHTYQILTKRPNRMQDWLSLNTLGQAVRGESWSMLGKMPTFDHQKVTTRPWPLPNVHLGVSVEDQATADERIPILLETPAAVRFVSAEPLLGPVDLTRIDGAVLDPEAKGIHLDALTGGCRPETPWHLNWVVVGGESGPRARPCNVTWIRSIKDQCQASGVPVFVKQLGARPCVVEGSRTAKEWYANNATAIMDDCGWIHTKDKKGGDMAEWPADLRVREFPMVPA